MVKQFDEEQYHVYVRSLTEGGVPQIFAERAAAVIARDNPDEPNLGRTAQDRADVSRAMQHYWLTQKDEK